MGAFLLHTGVQRKFIAGKRMAGKTRRPDRGIQPCIGYFKETIGNRRRKRSAENPGQTIPLPLPRKKTPVRAG